MKTILEIFYVRIVGRSVRYQRKQANLSRKGGEPRARLELEKKVVSHAMRHIAFLVQTGDQDDFEAALTPETKKVFKSLWVSLAGKVF